ncbi:HAD-IA family hydrolase [Paenibacillus sp. IB182496]|uniref:HAD-IA family hydrolase n=1 Tax=Paenibacillus sabuli TaxID=2772509 RepID=A0A927BPF4_9BACL|nr:HAD-IA family hydrolase [Paenibacillus sabuli]MBD2843847.1 HAD-IA family hydrolase [Paenibacillus sabuli]
MKPQLVLDVAGVLVENLSPGYWQALGRLSGDAPEELRAAFKRELRAGLWSGAVPEAEFWHWLQARCPGVDTATARRLLRAQLQPLPALARLHAWSRLADVHLLSNHRAEWLAEPLRQVAPLLASATISSAAGCRKPEPAIYRLAAAGLRPGPVVYVDDQQRNLAPAATLGWTTVLAESDGAWIGRVDRLLAEG